MPKPKKAEERKDFINRCMSDPEAISDFPDNKQRFAVCNSIYEQALTEGLAEDLAHHED